MLKFEAAGTLLWSKWIYPPVLDYVSHAVATPDGGYLLVGYEFKSPQALEYLLMKFDSDGNLQWSGLYGGTGNDLSTAVRITNEGDYLICGQTDSYGSNSITSIGIVKIDSSGTIVWQRVVGTVNENSSCQAMSMASNGAIYAATSITRSDLAGDPNIFVVKLSSEGTTEWVKVLGGVLITSTRNLEATDDNGVIVIGATTGFGQGSYDGVVVKLNESGEIQWMRTIGGGGFDQLFDITKAPSGGYAISGATVSGGVTSYELVLFTLSQDFSYCGNLVFQDAPFIVTDFTNHADLISLDPGFQSAIDSTAYTINTVAITNSDLLPSLTTLEGKPMCSVVGDASSQAASPSSSNECGCSEHGACQIDGSCICQTGYQGSSCAYTSADYASLTAQISLNLDTLNTNQPSLTDQAVLTDLALLTHTPQVLTSSAVLTSITILSNVIDGSSSSAEREAALQIFLNLSQVAQNQSAFNQPLSSALFQYLLSFSQLMLPNTLSLRTPGVSTSLTLLATTSQETVTVTPFAESLLSVELPSSLLNPSDSSVLIVSENPRNIYRPLRSDSLRAASSVISANFYINSVLTPLHNLTTPIRLTIPLLSSSPYVLNLTQAVFSSTPTTSKSQVIFKGEIACQFFDEATSQLSTEGCLVDDFSETTLTCTCTHLTDFMAFVSTSISTLEGSNYSVLLALPQITPRSLLSNIGFFLSLGYWVTFILFAVLAAVADSRACQKGALTKFQRKFQEEIPQTQEKNDFNTPEPREVQSQSIEPTQIETETIAPVERTSQQRKNTRQPSISSVSFYATNEQNASSISIKTTAKQQSTKQSSFAAQLRASLYKQLRHSKKRKGLCCCVCLCCNLIKMELSSNNQIYNLLMVASPLSPRFLRLTLCYLGLLLQFSLAALFFNLNPEEEEEGAFFWEGFIEDFWVAVYTVLFTVPLLILLALSLRPHSRLQQRAKEATSLESLQEVLKQEGPRSRCRIAVGMLFFIFISCFCCLYLVAFSHVASPEMSRDWLVSSFLSIAIDMLGFEIIPAFAVAYLGLLYFGCKMRCVMWLLLAIEGYRFIRNFVDT